MAAETVEIARALRASLAREVMARAEDPEVRVRLGIGVLALILRGFLRDAGVDVRRTLEAFVQAVLA